jgi:hypothetical protein
MVAVFLPVAVIFGFFAFPWGKDQPTEVWALAKIRFSLKPRRRIWDQSGVKELVTITAPKVVEEDYTNGLSQNEVRSRLRALADTIDSRGWAVKNANINMYGPPALVLQQPSSSDRLVDLSSFPQQQAYGVDVQASDDILDEKANPRAQKMESMISASTKAHRQKLLDEMSGAAPAPTPTPQPANNYWFLNQPSQPVSAPNGSVTFNTQVVTPGATDNDTAVPTPTVDEAALVRQLETQKEQAPTASYYGHLRTIQPLSAQKHQVPVPPVPMPPVPPKAGVTVTEVSGPPPPTPPPVTPAKQAAILQLASNNDLNVATIAREANREESPNEVVIKLH